MIPVVLRPPGAADSTAGHPRRKFGLDAPLPADRRTVERALLRHLADQRPAFVALAIKPNRQNNDAPVASPTMVEAGVPDLMLLAPGARVVFVKIKTQAETLSRAHRAFADLCRERDIPLLVVRSLPEARRALDLLGI